MKRTIPIAIAVAWTALWAAAPAFAAGPAAASAGGVMTSTQKLGEISIAPEPKLVNGELMLKVVALNKSQQPATFGPEDIEITTADGKTVPIMSLDALIAQARADARGGSTSYNSSYAAGPTTTYNQYGQPDISNFSGNSAPIGGQINPQAPVGRAKAENAAVARQVASLKAGILQQMSIDPGEVKGGAVITQRIRFHWREKHTLHIEVRFNGEKHEFELPAPPAG